VLTRQDLTAIVGTWVGTDLPTPNILADARITFRADGTFEVLLSSAGGTTLLPGSARGAYAWWCSVFYAYVEFLYDGMSWNRYSTGQPGGPPPGGSPATVSGDTLALSVDFTGDGTPETTWVLTRQ
jgi:hypothetical protein